MAAFGAVIAVGLYAATPFDVAARFQDAALNGDGAAVARLTDRPALRAALAARERERIVATMQSDDELHHNPLAGLGLAVVGPMAENRAAYLASPRGLAVLVATGEPPNSPIEVAFPPLPDERPEVWRSAGYLAWDRFALRVRRRDAPPERTTTLIFRRAGLLGWRLADVRTPR